MRRRTAVAPWIAFSLAICLTVRYQEPCTTWVRTLCMKAIDLIPIRRLQSLLTAFRGAPFQSMILHYKQQYGDTGLKITHFSCVESWSSGSFQRQRAYHPQLFWAEFHITYILFRRYMFKKNMLAIAACRSCPAVVISSRSDDVTVDELLKIVNEVPKCDNYSADTLSGLSCDPDTSRRQPTEHHDRCHHFEYKVSTHQSTSPSAYGWVGWGVVTLETLLYLLKWNLRSMIIISRWPRLLWVYSRTRSIRHRKVWLQKYSYQTWWGSFEMPDSRLRGACSERGLKKCCGPQSALCQVFIETAVGRPAGERQRQFQSCWD